MRSFRVLAAILLISLSGLLCWAWIITFRADLQRVSGEVELLVQRAADSIQRANLTENSFVAFFEDARKDEKLAFAIGMTSNRGKLAISFSNTDSATARAQANVPRISAAGLKARHVEYKPALIATIRQFDTLIRDELKQHRLHIPYSVAEVPERSKPIDSSLLRTRPFIINFFEPTVYELRYRVGSALVFGRLWPYTLSSVLMILFVGGALMLFYRSLRTQQQINLFRNQLFSSATHELKTPLSSLQLITEAFVQDEAGGTVSTSATHLEFAKTEIRRMNLLVNRILSFGRMTRAQLALDKTAFDPATIIQEANASLALVFRERNATVRVSVPEKIIVRGDVVLLTNMLVTILENALKHTPGELIVEISCVAEGNAVKIRISDNGPGIPQEYRKRIFEPFIRMPRSIAAGVPGQGLGLSFAMQVALIHDGSISVKDGPNAAGATFVVTLPNATPVP